jgi:acyl carrier protein
MDVSEVIRKIISAQTGMPPEKLTAELHFRMVPEIDSMRILQIILETENTLRIEIPDDVTFRVQTIGEYESVVGELCQQKSPT